MEKNFLIFIQAKKRMVKLVHKIIQERRKSNMARTPRDVVDVLLSDASEQLTDDLISENMIDLMIPGEDSVPVLMTLAIKYLTDCPPALQQLMVPTFFSNFLSQLFLWARFNS